MYKLIKRWFLELCDTPINTISALFLLFFIILFFIFTILITIAPFMPIGTFYPSDAKERYWLGAIGCGIISVAAYVMRCRARIFYGIIEIIIGMVAAILSAWPTDDLKRIQFVGSIYIIVRGFDNIEKSLKYYSDRSDDDAISNFLHKAWKHLFGPQT